MSLFHWIIVVAVIAAQIIPMARLFPRTGHSVWWCLLGLWPFVGMLLGVWIAAYSDWPALGRRS
jgi:uncharacterized membrane protein YhaH (DUF805 family)